ncbi:hypothetical protein ABT039_22415 [Streptomyces lasiicapitis]|uniref:hypothetical protein n=1 Tax=Streptomyces lasiicapitis TaxID=1923961 RepID=UPI00331E92D3
MAAAALAPERTLANLPAERRLDDLTPGQQDLHWALMELLGYQGGAATDDGGLTDQTERLTAAQEAAANAGIALPTGTELAECHTCGLIFNADHAHEVDGFTFCGEHAHEQGLTDGRPDTTFESRWD